MKLLGIIFALSSSIFWAASTVAVKKALKTDSALNITFLSVAMNVVYLWPAAFFLTPWERVGLDGIAILVLAGILAPTFGRLVRFMSVEKLGAALSSPLVNTVPMFSAIVAYIFLGEIVDLQIGLGISVIMIGVTILSLGEEKLKLSHIGILLSLASAASFGGAHTVYKVGATMVSSPILGAAVGSTIACISYYSLAKITKQDIGSLRGASWFSYVNGILTGIALCSTFAALVLERVVIVAPLIATNPLFVLLFSWIFLKKVERITTVITIASVLVVFGSILVGTA